MSIKAFRVRDANSLRVLPEYPTDAWLLDAYTPGSRGGTGEMFNWDWPAPRRFMAVPFFWRAG